MLSSLLANRSLVVGKAGPFYVHTKLATVVEVKDPIGMYLNITCNTQSLYILCTSCLFCCFACVPTIENRFQTVQGASGPHV